MSMSNETRTAEGSGPTVRCGRVGAVSHTTARSHPLAGEGTSDAGFLDVSSLTFPGRAPARPGAFFGRPAT